MINALSECQTMKDDLEKKKSKLRELSRQNSMDTTLALMQAAMAEAEEASDEVANQFLSKETSIEEFLKVSSCHTITFNANATFLYIRVSLKSANFSTRGELNQKRCPRK